MYEFFYFCEDIFLLCNYTFLIAFYNESSFGY